MFTWSRIASMALETLPSNVVVNGDFLLDPSKMVVFNPPLMLYTPPVLQQGTSELVPIPSAGEFRFEFSEVPKHQHVPAVVDRPEFVDVGALAAADDDEGPIAISDDDDVIFVGEYRDRGKRGEKEGRVRRNPVRKTRSTKIKDALYEDDFAFLDHSDEENVVTCKGPSIQTDPNYKQWPVNVHERPEYNTATKKIETFDYTIRELQKTAIKKKPRIECVPVRKKSKKNYCARRRKPRTVVVKKVPVDDIKDLVSENFEGLKQYLNDVREYRCVLQVSKCRDQIETKEMREERTQFIVNQATLHGIVNDLDQSELIAKLNKLKTE